MTLGRDAVIGCIGLNNTRVMEQEMGPQEVSKLAAKRKRYVLQRLREVCRFKYLK